MESIHPLIIIAGPTAVGKSDISVKLAEKINGEIISADSMQVYKGMTIGTGKLSENEMCGIKHYMIDEYLPNDEFNVMIFKDKTKKYINEIIQKKKIPLLVGGTAFYIQAVLYDAEFSEYNDEISIQIKSRLKNELLENGNIALYSKLKEIDPVTASIIHANDIKRVIRALEYYYLTGKPFSEHNEEQRRRSSPYNFKYFFINDDRDEIYNRINQRVDKMISRGLIDEVKDLLSLGYSRNLVSMQGLGYKEIAEYICGECTLSEAVYKIKRDTRHFAKRQITWQRKEKDITVIEKKDYNNDEEIANEIISQSNEILI